MFSERTKLRRTGKTDFRFPSVEIDVGPMVTILSRYVRHSRRLTVSTPVPFVVLSAVDGRRRPVVRTLVREGRKNGTATSPKLYETYPRVPNVRRETTPPDVCVGNLYVFRSRRRQFRFVFGALHCYSRRIPSGPFLFFPRRLRAIRVIDTRRLRNVFQTYGQQCSPTDALFTRFQGPVRAKITNARAYDNIIDSRP